MKIKKTKFSTMLSDLYGRDNYEHVLKEGREYWWMWPGDTVIGKKYGSGWYKIKITYIRSHCMFYIFSDYPDIPEQFCACNCFLSSSLVLAEIDPIKDLPDLVEDIELSKLKYCFDDTHTIVKNWPNEQEIEVNEDQYNKLNSLFI